MPRHPHATPVLLPATPALAVLLSVGAAGVAWSQEKPSAKIEPYTGPAVYLEESSESVPATVVGSDVQTTKYDNGKVRIERGLTKYSDNSLVSNGVYREFYPNGQQFVDGQYNSGDPAGEWSYWHPNGQLAKKVTYEQGKPTGTIELHREDGTLEARRSFAAGKRDGVWENFAADGETRLAEYAYAEGVPTGTWKWWYESGKPQRELSYQDGKTEGIATEWAEDGSKRAEVPFRDGKRHGVATQWTADGREISQKYEDGKPVNN
ncbi:MORN repeat variant [Posidoniimonas corsicana]|uniref:MORN repeat variant n=1 Tax=Posidoniimonas corsicana TaxID=1938618 RepID=A0A5C5VHP4_9BACT|nr:toxin-antitoxin system YwqK family antitoxin [Posidoniimonas corsicana]TWT38154.1 MORN repeat variant [Posidoniimonas corsicana]